MRRGSGARKFQFEPARSDQDGAVGYFSLNGKISSASVGTGLPFKVAGWNRQVFTVSRTIWSRALPSPFTKVASSTSPLALAFTSTITCWSELGRSERSVTGGRGEKTGKAGSALSASVPSGQRLVRRGDSRPAAGAGCAFSARSECSAGLFSAMWCFLPGGSGRGLARVPPGRYKVDGIVSRFGLHDPDRRASYRNEQIVVTRR